MIVQVQVTAEHIAKGVQEDCDRCPGALAIAQFVRPGISVEIPSGCILIGRIVMARPRELSKFIHTFDRLGRFAVSPITFPLDIPAEYLREEFRA